jgi:hypothetical protein
VPTARDKVWEQIEREFEVHVPHETRGRLEEAGLVADVLSTDRTAQKRSYAVLAAHALGITDRHPNELRPTDSRWQLWADLSERAGAPLWQPFRPSVRSKTRQAPGGAPVGRVATVTLELDARMPLDDVVRLLRRWWPKFASIGFVRPSRRMQPQTLAQVRHVCLDSELNATWEERWRSWEQRNRRRGRGWRFADRRAFITNFHRAEQALTGVRGGLAWFYEPLARAPDSELRRLARLGGESAAQELRRREDIHVDLLKESLSALEKEEANRG